MRGSSLAPIIIPIVVTLSVAIWLIMVYYADGHPCWRRRDQARHPRSTGSQPVSVTPVVDLDAFAGASADGELPRGAQENAA